MTVCNNITEMHGYTYTCDLKKGHAGQHSEAFPVAGGKTERVRWKNTTCPRCGGYIPNNETPGAYPGAISRVDNFTEICSSCGTDEAMTEWMLNHPQAR